jgi:hypothetical protein
MRREKPRLAARRHQHVVAVIATPEAALSRSAIRALSAGMPGTAA